MNALAVALALTRAPLVASPKVTASSLSTQISASAVEAVQMFVLLALLQKNNLLDYLGLSFGTTKKKEVHI
jgi:hypothetical protein